jgi:hypothetical protein
MRLWNCLGNSVKSEAILGAQQRERSIAHVAAAQWGKGVGALIRITMMTFRHPSAQPSSPPSCNC